MNKIKITLKSDICIGSGYAYAGIIDADVCYDDMGLPFIPARRLKGCLKEAAIMIGCSEAEIKKMFGKAGNNSVTGVIIENAYIDNYKKIRMSLECARRDANLAEYVKTQDIFALFTRVKAQTKIENDVESDAYGTAEENSLRFTRIISHFSPLNGKEMEFYADVYGEADAELMGKVCKALRNMGMHRTRGLGSVKCELISSEYAKGFKIDKGDKLENDKNYIMSYKIKSITTVAINNSKGNVSENYINGSAVIGCLAGEYLRKNEADELFHRLFVYDNCKYSNLYICDDEHDYYPAPYFLQKKKISGDVINLAAPDAEPYVLDEETNHKNKSMKKLVDKPKSLKNKFCYMEKGSNGKYTFGIGEVKTEMVYHNTRNESKDYVKTENEGLYTAEVLSAGQMFAGSITANGSQMKEIIKLFNHVQFRFGRSRSAQYGRFELVDAKVKEVVGEKITLNRGSRLVAYFVSDAIFSDSKNGYTVLAEQITDKMEKAIGHVRARKEECPEDEKNMFNFIRAHEVDGYYSVWNMKKQALPAIAAGSFMTFETTEDVSLPTQLYVGEKNTEGFGHVRLIPCDDFSFAIESTVSDREEKTVPNTNTEGINLLLQRLILMKMAEKLKVQAFGIKFRDEATAAAMGRVALMLKEALNENTDDSKAAFDDFMKRINSIKDEPKKKKIKKIILDSISTGKGGVSLDKLIIEQPDKDALEKAVGGNEKAAKLIESLWEEYLLNILTGIKYKHSIEKKAKEAK